MCADRESHPSVRKLADASNRLGFRLLPLLLKQDAGENVFLSPFSITLALAMTYNGAEGETKQALAEALGLADIELADVNEANQTLMSVGQRLEPAVQLHIANSIWVRQGAQPASEFVQAIKDVYDGKFASVDLADPAAADVINNWVARKTYDRIDQLVTPDLIELAILVLINAIAFKGIWTARFDQAKTAERPFTLLDGSRKRLPMMSQQGRYDYLEDDHLQVVSLPYGAGRISMIVCLPKPGVPLEALHKALATGNWHRWMSQLAKMEGEIALPRFKVAYGAELLPHLEVIGGEAIGAPDLLGMGAGPLLISNVIHKAFMEVNEAGTEAAAATAVFMARSVSRRFSISVDHPFFCAIRDAETGLILFMGFVLNPSRI